ncbi:glutaminyl-peptide cyclotransferase [Pseudodesulfovibrio cashew]|uniref:Glutaminyl-peptide cyclotransferase n=1 Tax=Pseudodesulfovibrio cashew TaxID=2678688 RepID=A0A6I6JCQ5_9BACT|nr:glutaminyl-peptide cyclotransferase [Pseudodesulfovibrio cashew]QGY38868.1 glutaminyl-peptide cyclotransferase [Pseudodesulfovibrio cashew]
MTPRKFPFILRLLVLLPLIALLPPLPKAAAAPTYPCRVAAEFPHNPESYTQGLFVHDGKLYESSGGFGESYLAVADIESGDYLLRMPVPRKYFAEGIAPYRDRLFLLTWLSGTGFLHSLGDLELLTSFAYRPAGDTTEGWGLTFDGQWFISSSGKDSLRFHDPEDFAMIGGIKVRDGREPVRLLNELEYVGGMVLANIWKRDRIAVIDPESGKVRAWIDLSPLRKRIAPASGVANGIAYEKETGRLFVTGKHWDKLFEITVDEVLWRRPVSMEQLPQAKQAEKK